MMMKCAPRTRTQALRRPSTRLSCLTPAKRRCRVLDAPECSLCACLAVASIGKKVVATVCALFTSPDLSKLIVLNPVLGKNLERPRLTRYCSDVSQVRWKLI